MLLHRPPTARTSAVRRALTLLLSLTATATLLVACGEDQPTSSDETTTTAEGGGEATTGSSLEDVTITEEDSGPVLDFDKPFGVAETTSLVVEEGDGEDVGPGAAVTFDYLIVNGTDGEQVDSSYGGTPTTVPIDTAPPFLTNAIMGVPVGSRVLIAVAPGDGFGADEESGLAATDSLLMLVDVKAVSTPLDRAEGAAVTPAAGLPTVVLDADGAPTITVPDGEAPTELIVQPLIEGTGPVVEAGQSITVHYTGVLYDGGTVFDSSWQNGEPVAFAIGTGNVIAGWDKGLVGQTVGSQILLVIPPADGYGEAGSGDTIPPNAALVFVVDILAAT
jgi:peptidylprolyl isomerase